MVCPQAGQSHKTGAGQAPTEGPGPCSSRRPAGPGLGRQGGRRRDLSQLWASSQTRRTARSTWACDVIISLRAIVTTVAGDGCTAAPAQLAKRGTAAASARQTIVAEVADDFAVAVGGRYRAAWPGTELSCRLPTGHSQRGRFRDAPWLAR